MSVSFPVAEAAIPSRAVDSAVEIPQLGLRAILAIWAAAAFPMGALAWLVAPAVADRLSGDGNVPMAKALLACLTVGLIWQFLIVAVLVYREQRSLRWSTIQKRSGSGRRGARAAAVSAAACG